MISNINIARDFFFMTLAEIYFFQGMKVISFKNLRSCVDDIL